MCRVGLDRTEIVGMRDSQIMIVCSSLGAKKGRLYETRSFVNAGDLRRLKRLHLCDRPEIEF